MLYKLLNKCHNRFINSSELIALPLLCSIKALLNSTIGRQWVQDSSETLKSVAWALDLQSARCKVISLEILSGLCFCAEFGHRAVLKALTQVKSLRGERTRFQRLIDDLHREHGNTPRDTVCVRRGIMSLINALLKGGDAEHSLEYRVHLRLEFLMLGIIQVLEQIRSAAPEGEGSALDDHIDLFEMMRQEDEQEMQRISEHSSASISSSYSSSPSDPFHNSSNNNTTNNIFNNNSLSSSNQQLPPIRPPIGQAPPPPPPSAKLLRLAGNGTLIITSDSKIPKKKVPITKCSVKTLNWTPINKDKLKGTIWENIEEEDFYNQIDIETLSEHFASGKSSIEEQQQLIDGGCSNNNNNITTLPKNLLIRQIDQISVIDSRRAQNCTIMLATLKMSHRDIRHTLLGMDEKCRLSRDVLEQMLKFIPTREELLKMKETLIKKRKQYQSLALADRFLWEMGQIPRYEQRLKCLCTIRSFQDRCAEIRPGILAISRASHALCNSKRLNQFLALILAIGNILNEGKRLGNCYGFTISSLDQIPSVRSVIRSDRNLLHFIAEQIECKWHDLLRLKREMNIVLEAAKVDRHQLEKELCQLEMSVLELVEELTHYQETKKVEESSDNIKEEEKEVEENSDKEEKIKNVGEIPEEPYPQQKILNNIKRSSQVDRFVPVVKTFLEEARKQMTQLREELTEMRQKLSICVNLFGASIESKRSNSEIILPHSDQFFGPFARCINGLAECHHTVWAEREEIEAKKRQFLVRTLFNQKRKEGQGGGRISSHSSSISRVYKNGVRIGKADKDFESIVNMLQTGEIFSEELNRLRTSVRIKYQQQQQQQ
ncbi:FH2 domain-containing protein [Meloidogyne graminicola]|uniref:FH2 domain-containing protein n=1 Tax=Meloidogyne graminicola TaxID=189291 RepID=A0A8S9ZVP7_9BILA|nr:FH2 domain-containing protein [Meloidogyne graminicola]